MFVVKEHRETFLYPIIMDNLSKTPRINGTFPRLPGEELDSVLTSARCFIIDQPKIVSQIKEEMLSDGDRRYIDLPFTSCWVEFDNDVMLEMSPTQDLVALHFYEKAPGRYIKTVLVNEGGVSRLIAMEMEPGSVDFNDAWALWKVISSPKHSSWSEESTNFRFKIRSGAGKTVTKVKSVIHVSMKKEGTKKPFGVMGAPIHWTHKWEVRGHWRKLEGTGRDRSGERIVSGATWVAPYEKGVGVLPAKTRKV